MGSRAMARYGAGAQALFVAKNSPPALPAWQLGRGIMRWDWRDARARPPGAGGWSRPSTRSFMNRRILLQVTAPAILIGLLLFGTCLVAVWYINRSQANLA